MSSAAPQDLMDDYRDVFPDGQMPTNDSIANQQKYPRRSSDNFIKNGNHGQDIVAMSYGVPRIQNILDRDPFVNMNQVVDRKLMPQVSHLSQEVFRRCDILESLNRPLYNEKFYPDELVVKTKAPVTTHWKKHRIIKWLSIPEHDITNEEDREFLMLELVDHRDCILKEIAEQAEHNWYSIENKWT